MDIEQITRAQLVIASASLALCQLHADMNDNFCAASDLIWHAQGKVVVTGMGKSGHVAGKIAATFQSTGQEAVFLDPAAAAHGDMGIIRRGDIVLALSNSGKTAEILPVAIYAASHSAGMIAITGGAASPLAELADIVLGIPDMPEGCPIGRAPMASAIMQMSLGDALAAELMHRRGFTDADFLAIHHGGYLGQSIAAACAGQS